MKRYALGSLLALATWAAPAHGQANPDSVKLRNDCRLANQVLATGHPATHVQWATAVIHYCGADAVAAANRAALTRLRSSSDTVELAQIWNQLQYVRDARIYRMMMDIAQDPGASEFARVKALVWLLRLRRPDQFATLAEVTGGFDSEGNVRGGCGRYSRLAGTSPFEHGEPLPSNFEAEISELGRRVSSDPSQPLGVRTAARCAQTLGYSVR
jgi:hypothetical protein